MNIVRSHFNQQKSRKPARQIQFNFYSCSRQLINIPEFKPSCIKSLKLKNKKYTTFVEKPVYTHTRRKEEAFRGGRFCPRAVHIDYISLFFSFFFFINNDGSKVLANLSIIPFKSVTCWRSIIHGCEWWQTSLMFANLLASDSCDRFTPTHSGECRKSARRAPARSRRANIHTHGNAPRVIQSQIPSDLREFIIIFGRNLNRRFSPTGSLGITKSSLGPQNRSSLTSRTTEKPTG